MATINDTEEIIETQHYETNEQVNLNVNQMNEQNVQNIQNVQNVQNSMNNQNMNSIQTQPRNEYYSQPPMNIQNNQQMNYEGYSVPPNQQYSQFYPSQQYNQMNQINQMNQNVSQYPNVYPNQFSNQMNNQYNQMNNQFQIQSIDTESQIQSFPQKPINQSNSKDENKLKRKNEKELNYQKKVKLFALFGVIFPFFWIVSYYFSKKQKDSFLKKLGNVCLIGFTLLFICVCSLLFFAF